ncbi:hypothetical protein CONCODRAFT_7734 [Conidiobolus coronatus NRRL 28638]|uniref:P-type ATPase A domain-containing protein n=1 Tax=Conidiobolus coronatus (strain ATCC 28846 / CBS 209.66 / NRRL 28638) TaxID=796925 RepID=A0A137P435_CONC2|nr:hypothetical protein CONCODRAFT_7734 [Conidiobolus coronatus NRRL 28638]|eukprot:KXN69788.1 hypothetical protein CONCODRAFT_7734 [Conidiobolus coronatus NRRL 28638]
MILYYFVICYLVTYYNSKTVFHTVNVLDLDGNVCPLPTRRNVACPKLCVQNLDQCPPKLKPSCGEGMAYCGDGKCYKDKCPETIINPCSCGQPSDLGVIPCNITLVTLVEVKNYKKADEPQLLSGECVKQLEYQGEWSIYNGEKLDKPFWLQCPRSTDPVFNYNETIWKAVFGYVGVQVGILIIWQIYKFISEMGSRDMFACENSPPTSESFDSRNSNNNTYAMETEKTFRSKYLHLMESNELFPISGYKSHIFGTLGFYTLCLTTIMFWVFIFINVLDYYGDITGTPFGVYKNSWALSSKTMMAVWICTAVWLVGLNIVKTRVRNHFRVRVNPLTADYIEIKKPEHPSILSENQTTRLVKLVQALENMVKKFIGWDKLITTEKLHRTQTGRFYFTYQCTRLIYQEKLGFFAPHQFQLGDSYEAFYPLINGITVEEANRRLELKGPNFISVKVDKLPMALARELMGFFYAYQFMLFTILFYIDYYIMAFVITAVIVFSAFVKVITKRSSELRVKGMAEQTSQVKVLRDGRWLEYSSDQLVPGDVIAILDKEVLRCDCVLLSGKAVLDESSLTGEPLPIRKFPLPTDHTNFDATSHSKMHVLFDGTKTVQVVPDPGELYVKALVLETCTSTDKGRLIQKILYSQPITFIFDEELKVAIVLLVLWGFFIFGFGVWFMSQELAVAWFYSVFAIAGVINPLLPAALVIGQSVAAKRLRDHRIFCVDYPRIIIAGKVELFCFDKTGTLTKDGLDYLGGQPTILTGGGVKLGEMTADITKYPLEFEMGLASCHSVASVNGMMVGNPVDIEMFKYVDWNLELPEQVTYLDTIKSNAGKKIHVVQRFQFVHARASMSVAILDPNTGHVHVYVKGSFEKLKELCKSTTFPVNYDEQTEGWQQEDAMY